MARIIPNSRTYIGFIAALSAGTATQQTVSISGTPTGGTFTLTVPSTVNSSTPVTTGAIAYNATAANVATALNTAFNRSDITATGGALPGSSVVVTFPVALSKVALMTANSAGLTGGTTPAASATLTVAGVNNSSSAGLTVADVNATINLTSFCTSLNASLSGNAVPTPDLSQLFENNIIGTYQATFSADFYRDDTTDTAWNTLPRNTGGYILVARYGGIPNTAGTLCEVWPITVLSRTMSNMASNSVETFTVTCVCPAQPNDNAKTVA